MKTYEANIHIVLFTALVLAILAYPMAVSAATLTLSGTLFSDKGVTPIITGKTIKAAIGTSSVSVHTDTSDGSGNFSFTIDNSSGLAVDTPVVVWVDGAAEDAVTVSKFASTVANVTGVALYQNTIIVRQEGSTSTALADLAFYDSADDADIEYTATTTTDELTISDGNELHIWTGDTFVNAASSTFSGSFTNDGVFDNNNGTMKFIGTTETISGSTTASSSLGNIIVAGSYTMSNSASTSDLTIQSGGSLTAPATSLTIDGVYTNEGVFTHNGGEVYFQGNNPFNLLGATHNGERNTTLGATRGLAFTPDGTKLYIMSGFDNTIRAYDPSAPWDVSSLSYTSESFTVSAQEGAALDFYFSVDGTKLYVVGRWEDTIFAYDLSVAWDVSSATYNNESFSVAAQETWPRGVTFASDGSKVYVIGRDAGTIYAYDLSVAWDVSSATYNNESFSVATQETSPTSLAFNPDGTVVYIVGYDTDTIYAYDLSTAWDVSSATYDNESFGVAEQNFADNITFSIDGTKVYVGGGDIYAYDTGNAVHSGVFTGSSAFNNVTIADTVQVFQDTASTADLTISSGATLKTPSTTLTIAGDYSNSGTLQTNGQGTLALTGTAKTLSGTLSATSSFNRLTIVGSYTASNSASTTDLTIASGGSFTAPSLLSIDGDYTNNGTFTHSSGTVYASAVAYDTTDALHKGEVGRTALENNTNDVTFSTDGTKMYTAGSILGVIIAHDLSVPFDVSTVSYNREFIQIAAQEPSPQAVAFTPDGTKMYVVGNRRTVYAYDLSVAWDVSSATYNNESFSVVGQASAPNGLAFNPDGTKVYVSVSWTDSVFAYDLSVAWDVSSATYNNESFSFRGQRFDMEGLSFSADGSKMFTLERSTNTIYAYNLAVPWEIHGAIYNDDAVGVDTPSSVNGFAFNADGTKLFMMISDSVLAYELNTPQTFSGTLTGNSAFHHFTNLSTHTLTFTDPASTTGSFTIEEDTVASVIFNAGDSYTFQDFNARGYNKHLTTSLVSSASGTSWYLSVPGNATASKLYLQDSDVCGSAGGGLTASSSVDGGNNACWTFIVGDTVDISGTLFSDLGVTPIVGGETVKLATGRITSTTSSNGLGEYVFAVENDDLTFNQAITVFVDGNPSTRAALVVRATSTESSISGLDLYADYLVIAQSGTTTAAVTLDTLSTYDGTDDADLKYEATLASSSLQLTDGQGLYIANGATFIAPASTTIDGSFKNLGTFTNSDGTITFSGDDVTIGGDLTGTSTLGSISLFGSTTLSNNASTTDLTVATNATLTAPALLSIKGSYTNNGIFDSNSGTIYTTAKAYNIKDGVYAGESFGVAAQEIWPKDLAFNTDGTKVYVSGSWTDSVFAYDLSVAWDVSSATYNNESFSVSGQEPTPDGLAFNPGGTKMYVVGRGEDTIFAYDLSVAFDVSSTTYNNESFSVSGQDSSPHGLAFNTDGTKVYIVGRNTNTIYAYDLSTAWDVSSATYNNESFRVAGPSYSPEGIAFNSDGTKTYVIDSADVIYAYDLSTPFNVSSATYNNESFSVSAQELSPTGLAFDADGSKVYIIGETKDTIYAYDLEVPQTFTGSMVGDSAFGDFISLNTQPLTFASPASTTGQFRVADVDVTTVVFNAGDSYTFQDFEVVAANKNLPTKLLSSASGTAWYLNVPGNATATRLYIQDSNACGSAGGGLAAVGSTDGGNNTCWTFSIGPTTIFSGVLYSDAGVTPIASGKTITLLLIGNFDNVSTTAVSDGSGVYSASFPQVDLDSGNTIFAYVDDGGVVQAVAVTKVSDSTTDITDLDIYEDTVILRSESSTLPLLMSELNSLTKTNDSDIPYTFGTYDNSSIYFGFETATVTPLITSGTALWMATTSAVHSGTYSAVVGDGGFAHLELEINSSDIGFSYKVSTEYNYDFLRFYINDVLQNSWSGTIDWTSSPTYVLPAGTSTVRWTYTKDACCEERDDKVWIDDIRTGAVLANVYLQDASTTLRIWEDTTVTTDRSVVMGGNAGGVGDGDLVLGTSSSLTANNDVYVAGSLAVGPDASFSGAGSLVFNASTTGKTLSGTMVATSSLPDVHFVGSGSWAFSDNASTSAVTIGENASVTAPARLSIGGDYLNAGVFTHGGGIVYAAAENNLSHLVYSDESFSVTNQDNDPEGFAVNPDGTKIYISGNTTDSVYAYDLSVPFDVSSATYNNESFSVAAQETIPSGLVLNSDGTKVYVLGETTGTIYAYDLSTAWDVSSATYDNESFSVADQDSNPHDLALNSDGTKLYVVGRGEDTIFAYDLSVAWDVSSATYNNESFSVAAQETWPAALTFNVDGSKVYITGGYNSTIYAYDLSVPFDVNSATYNNESFSVAVQESVPYGLAFSPDDTRVFIVGQDNTAIYAYDFEVAYSGDMVAGSAFNDFNYASPVPLHFTAAASTTGTFTTYPTQTSSVTFNAGSQYTFENIDWQGGSSSSELILQSSASGTEWYLDVPGNQVNVRFVDVQDSNAASSTGGNGAAIAASDSTDSGNNSNWNFGAAVPTWNATDFTLFDTITIDSTNIDEDLTNFPVYVDLADLSAQFWSTITEGGGDIRVTTGISTQYEIPREVVSASTTPQTGELHFKAPLISSTTDTVFRIYYNGTASDYATGATYGAENVWTNSYSAVWHAESDGADSTGNGHTLSASGQATVTDSGKLGGAFSFDGTGDYYSASSFSSHASRNVYTISAWSYLNTIGTTDNNDDSAILSYGTSANLDLLWFNVNQNATGERAYSFNAHDAGVTANRVNGGSTPNANSWHYVAATRNSTNREIFYNGSNDGSVSGGNNANNLSSAQVRIGSWAQASTMDFDGRIDNVRVASVERSNAWISAEYRNQSTATDFYSVNLTAMTGSSTLANHDDTQVNNAFDFQNKTDEALFAFKLTPESGNATVTDLTITLSGAKKVDVADFSNLRLFRDHDNDAEYDVTDAPVGGAGVMALADGRGTITFSDDFLASTSGNYLLVADWNAPDSGSFLKLSLPTTGLRITDSNGIQDVYGSVSDIQHNRNSSGGGGGLSAAAGAVAPLGRSVETGGEEGTGGEYIGDDPDYKWPTAHFGDWSNSEHAYDKNDGTHATASGVGITGGDFLGHGFVVPGSNDISGVEVKLEISGTTAAGNIGVQLSWDGGTSWTTTKTTPTLTTSDAVVSLGGASDTWGRTWSAGEFSNANFAVRLTGNPSNNTVQVDAIQVRVYHQATGGAAGGGSAI